MNVFALVRRTLWAVILAACVVVVTLYFAVMQVFLSTQSLQTVANKSELAQTVRNDVLLPKVLDAAKSSQYRGLLDTTTVTQAFDAAVSEDALNKKLDPAVTAVQEWLNSKQPTISFSIDISELSSKFADNLADAVSKKVSALPACNYTNTLADAENAVCRSPFVTKAELSSEVTSAVKAQASLGATTISPSTITLPASAVNAGSNLPEYLNVFYGVSIVAAGVGALIILWLLFKHRLSGIITIGVACVVSAAVLYGITLTFNRITAAFANDALAKKIVTEASTAFATFIRGEAQWLAIGGIIAIILAGLIKFAIHKHSTRGTMHAEHHGQSKRTLD